jgi:hypothetical protein
MSAINQLNDIKRNIRRLCGIRRMDCDVVHEFLIELYQSSRDGQTSVEAFCELFLTSSNEPDFDKEYEWDVSPCEPCETTTPTVPDEHNHCAVCSTPKKEIVYPNK